MALEMRDNPAEHRYEALKDGELVAVSVHEPDGPGTLALVHTEVAEGHDGHGLAEAITLFALSDVRSRGLALAPYCPYVRRYVDEHREGWLDLVAPERRAEFDLSD